MAEKKYNIETIEDNYYYYPIINSLKQDFENIKPKKGDKIFSCIYKINKNTNIKVILHPFIQYLLYKYPESKDHHSNLLIFPFTLYKSGSAINVANELTEELLDIKLKPIGYTIRTDGYYFFYETKIQINVEKIMKNDNLWWCLIDEICNYKKVLNFDIHKSVYTLFYQKPDLIYLKDKNKENIEIPIVSYFGGDESWLPFISSLGVPRNHEDTRFGPYFFFGSFEQQTRFAGWDGLYPFISNTEEKEKNIDFNNKKNLINSKRKQGGYVRFAIFLGDTPKYILYRETDTYYFYINALDGIKLNQTKKQQEEISKKEKEWKDKWINNYDSVIYSTITWKNIKGYFNIDKNIVVKNIEQQIPLSYHLLDMKTLKTIWDPFYEDYCIL